MEGLGAALLRCGYCSVSAMILFPTTHTFQRTDFFRSSRLYHNAERARTCNSVVTKVPGLFASVNNSTDPETDTIIGYISPAGIPSIASQKEQEHDVITPYGAWPTIMFDKAVGLAWWHNMVTAKKMQSECILVMAADELARRNRTLLTFA